MCAMKWCVCGVQWWGEAWIHQVDQIHSGAAGGYGSVLLSLPLLNVHREKGVRAGGAGVEVTLPHSPPAHPHIDDVCQHAL